MNRVVALLRAINVGGNVVAMRDIARSFLRHGHKEVETWLRTGNVIFSPSQGLTIGLDATIEADLFKDLRLKTTVLVRSEKEFRNVMDWNPFPAEAQEDPSHLVVYFLRELPAKCALDTLARAHGGPERLSMPYDHLYVVYPKGIARSKLTLDKIEKALQTSGTGRNWNTVCKLRQLCAH